MNIQLMILIGERTVLTSAHCLNTPFEAFIIAGLQSINLKLPIVPLSNSGGQIVKVTKAVLHEKFRMESEYDYDIALAYLSEDLLLGGTV
jgi:V8-like Glu-specific endopeptidase